MLYSVKGKLIHTEPGIAVVECGGVGFKCFVTMHTQRNLPKLGEEAMLFTHLNVREDAMDLFGFYSRSEMSCFKMLTSVSGLATITPAFFSPIIPMNRPIPLVMPTRRLTGMLAIIQ